jgi:hypothetical protein
MRDVGNFVIWYHSNMCMMIARRHTPRWHVYCLDQLDAAINEAAEMKSEKEVTKVNVWNDVARHRARSPIRRHQFGSEWAGAKTRSMKLHSWTLLVNSLLCRVDYFYHILALLSAVPLDHLFFISSATAPLRSSTRFCWAWMMCSRHNLPDIR